MASPSCFKSLIQSPLVKTLVIGLLIFLLQIPITRIDQLVWERSHHFKGVSSEITDKWGGE